MHRSENKRVDVGYQNQASHVWPSGAKHRWGVVLAGGDGTRLQPLTRLACGDNRPKQFCPLIGGETLLAYTRQRIARTVEPDRMLFVLTKKHEPFYKEELKYIPDAQKIVQPRNQGTLPAILWSLLHIFRADQNALVAFFPSDHYFANEDGFISTIERTFQVVDVKRDSVVLLGAVAERPETEYGWIEPESALSNEREDGIAPVLRFWEKPPLNTARELLTQGCLWNTFVMIGSAGAFLEMTRHTSPVLVETFEAMLTDGDLESEGKQMQLLYDGLVGADFSRDVLSLSTERLLVASCGEVGWSDLGEPRRFIAALAENGVEDPWAVGSVCNRCGLTQEQLVTLSGRSESDTSSKGMVLTLST